MEKICIVKRRREYAQTEVKLILPDNLSDTLPSEVAISSIAINNHPEFSDNKTEVKLIMPDNLSDSITMTKEQSVLLQQSEYIKELLSGAKNDPSLDIKLNPDGRISLNYHFNDSLILRMLSSNQVCQMLQISRSFLRKIINEKKLNSYKLGRMRRFLLEDILEYLSNDAEVTQLNDEQ